MNDIFEKLELDPRIISNLSDLNFKTMTPIQAKSLPLILAGSDVIAQAKTGSGKTVAFGLGIINALDVKVTRPQSLILCPTRELADQVAKEMRRMARTIPNVKILTITGGKSEFQQEKSLNHGAHIIVGTPGRVLKLLKRRILNLDLVKYFVLDEADRMLDMGFSEDLHKIEVFIPNERQTLLFSATFPEDIIDLGSKIQRGAVEVSVDTFHDESIIKEEFIELDSHKDKDDVLLKILAHYQASQFIIFCKTKIICDNVAKKLRQMKVSAKAIHGDLDQNERTKVLTQFSNSSLCGIVATDVAARGIDIKGIDLVINYDLTNDPEVYVHRVGRTGRAGNIGHAVSFVTPNEDEVFARICDYQGSDFKLKRIDDFNIDQEYEVTPKMKTIYISGGKKDKLRPGDIVGAIVGEAGVSADLIGDISITPVISYVAVDASEVQQICDSLSEGKIKKRRFRVGILS